MRTYLALIFSGAVLMALEVFVPGGIVGTIGVLLLIGAAFAAITGVGGLLGIALAVLSVTFGCVMLYLVVKLFPNSFVGKNLSLSADMRESHAENAALAGLLGAEGVARTILRPAGFAELHGKRIDVVTHGEIVEEGAKVRVVEIEGNRVVVVKG
jgi:membrane-bound serine protease (ClpP class)